MARDRMLPPGLARIHHVFRTPARITAITGVIVAVFAGVFPLADLLTLVDVGNAGGIRNRLRRAYWCCASSIRRGAALPAPCLPFFSVVGTAVCLYLITGLQLATWMRYGIWFLVGLFVYAIYGFQNSRLRVKLPRP